MFLSEDRDTECSSVPPFSLNVDLVFFDLTSTYFEGNGPVGFALHGHSRDGKPRNRQVLVGMVMIDGWPIAHHVFQGNLRDSTTVEKVLQDLQSRFGLRRVVFVGDRGMVTSGNLDRLRSSGQGYLVGLKRRRQPEILGYLEGATGPWLECPAGISAGELSASPFRARRARTPSAPHCGPRTPALPVYRRPPPAPQSSALRSSRE
jgi:hypothetical protein